MRSLDLHRLLATMVLLGCAGTLSAQVVLTRATNFSVHAGTNDKLVTDLLGGIWTLPMAGGAATPLADVGGGARGPRWSPDGTAIVFQARDGDIQRLRVYDAATKSTATLGSGMFFDQHPDWHPDSTRIVFSSLRKDSGFDIWEMDVPTELAWRLTNLPGDELEPAYSGDGRNLAYVHREQGRWSIMLRQRGQPDRVLESSTDRLSSLAWRPDGSLITFLRHAPSGLSLEMIILSDPLLIRPLVRGEDFFVAPVTWPDRDTLLYTADGKIRQRQFDAWSSSDIPFSARIAMTEKSTREPPPVRRLKVTDAPTGRLIVRVGRVFDGLYPDYQENRDIVIDGARITAVESVAPRAGENLLDLSELTAVPGLIDADAVLPESADPSLGPLLLSYGVTTIVVSHPAAANLDATWSGKLLPGPRVLGADWQLGLDTATSLTIDRDGLPASPRGIRYEDFRIGGETPSLVISGLADARTAGLQSLLASRQARLLEAFGSAPRPYVGRPELETTTAAVILGSRPNRLPPGIAQQAELLALVDAGLSNRQALHAAGVGAASALGLGLQTGRLAPGAAADFLLIDGDPLAELGRLQRIVAVVRNGRFFSTIGLIEKGRSPSSVE